ncbi:MAG: hypothetical protein AAGA19_11605 [Pseudomonadota bacterium]
MRLRHAILAGGATFFSATTGAASSAPDPFYDPDGWSLTGFAGVMTDNVWEESIQPWETEFLDSYLIGLGLRRDWPVAGSNRYFIGIEGQTVAHFGDQTHLEFNAPVVLSYRPQGRWSGPVDVLSFGLGLSYASEIPQTEINRDGASQRLMIYWMAEVAVPGPIAQSEVLFRLHHRSDGFGLFEENSGSNALTIGIRRSF